MDSTIARQLYNQRLDALGPEGREQAILRIHDAIASSQREKIEHAYAEFRRQHDVDPVIMVVDVLYDEFGERVGVSTHGVDLILAMQQKAFYADGYAALVYAFTPQGARDILIQHYTAQQADTALQPAGPGKMKLFICAMDALSGFDAVIPE